MKLFLLFALVVSSCLQAQEIGSGASYLMEPIKGPSIHLSIYIADKTLSDLGIEYYFMQSGFAGIQMWQRFKLRRQGGNYSIIKGYYFADTLDHPEIMPEKMYKGQSRGVELSQFIFRKKSEIDNFFLKDEEIILSGHKVKSKKYQVKKDKQVVTFWISEKALPIGLVMLDSTSSEREDHNFKIRLQKLIKNVKAKIDPAKAKPQSEAGKKLFPSN